MYPRASLSEVNIALKYIYQCRVTVFQALSALQENSRIHQELVTKYNKDTDTKDVSESDEDTSSDEDDAHADVRRSMLIIYISLC